MVTQLPQLGMSNATGSLRRGIAGDAVEIRHQKIAPLGIMLAGTIVLAMFFKGNVP